eukprot:9004735-Pyramimonas_sp.AAC.1
MYSDEYFSSLQSDSLTLWHELQDKCGQQLLDNNGLLFYGEADTGETVEGSIPGAREVGHIRSHSRRVGPCWTGLLSVVDFTGT